MWNGEAVSSSLLKQRHSFPGMHMRLLCPQLEGFFLVQWVYVFTLTVKSVP